MLAARTRSGSSVSERGAAKKQRAHLSQPFRNRALAEKMRLHIASERDLLNSGAQKSHQPVVIYLHAELVEKRVELRSFRRWIEKQQNASLFFPEIAQQFHLPIGEIVLRPVDDDRL